MLELLERWNTCTRAFCGVFEFEDELYTMNNASYGWPVRAASPGASASNGVNRRLEVFLLGG